MRYHIIIIILGVWIAVLPFLGFPFSWKKILFLIPGALLVIIGALMTAEWRRKKGRKKQSQKSGMSYAENDITKVEVTIPNDQYSPPEKEN